MANFLFVSDTNLTLGLAMRAELEGHDVRYLTQSNVGGGLVKIFNKEERWIPNVAVYDHNRFGTEADNIRSEGYKVLGPSRWSSMLETDENYKRQIITSLGWPTESITGTHFYISAWFNGASFIASYTSLIYRRFMTGGCGADLACTGLISDFRGLTARTEETFLKPLEKMLKKVNHRGCVHVHAVINEDQYAVKEIFASFAHPHNLVMYENTNLSVSEILLRLFDETSKPIVTLSPWAAGVQVSIPPYPNNILSLSVCIEGIVPANLKHLWLADVSLKDSTYSANHRGLVGYVTARGIDANEAVRRMYRTVGNLRIPDIQYRTDIGRNIHSLMQSLSKPGWII